MKTKRGNVSHYFNHINKILAMKFLGIDLGWRSGASGLSRLSWEEGELRLIDIGREKEIDSIIAWVESLAPGTEKRMGLP